MAAKRAPNLTPAQKALLTEANKAKEDAGKAMRAHARHCYRCHKAISMTADYCDTGWPLAKARARAIHKADKARLGLLPVPIQSPLF